MGDPGVLPGFGSHLYLRDVEAGGIACIAGFPEGLSAILDPSQEGGAEFPRKRFWRSTLPG